MFHFSNFLVLTLIILSVTASDHALANNSKTTQLRDAVRITTIAPATIRAAAQSDSRPTVPEMVLSCSLLKPLRVHIETAHRLQAVLECTKGKGKGTGNVINAIVSFR